MPSTIPYARIAITLPPQDLEAADQLAARLDRSRSWVMAEALRQFVAQQAAGTLPPLDELRRAQLQRDLALTPAQRVHEAEATAQLRVAAGQPRQFTSYEAFADWRREKRPER